jgi:hypothetical protein
VDTFHDSYRLSLYAPFWIINHTDLKLEFRVCISLDIIIINTSFYSDWE